MVAPHVVEDLFPLLGVALFVKRNLLAVIQTIQTSAFDRRAEDARLRAEQQLETSRRMSAEAESTRAKAEVQAAQARRDRADVPIAHGALRSAAIAGGGPHRSDCATDRGHATGRAAVAAVVPAGLL